MDPVTHTLVGVGMANAFFRRNIGPAAVPILAVASNLPDIDAIVHLTGDSTAILMRRTLGHSLFLLPFWSLGLSLIFRWVYPRIPWPTLYGMVLLGAGLHLFFDLVNSFGVVLLWPWSDWRPELGIIFIIDLVLTGLLLIPLVLCIPKAMRRYLPRLSQWTVGAVLVYVMFCGANRILANQVLDSEAQRSGIQPDFTYVFPEPLGPHRWHGVVREGNQYHSYLVHSLSRTIESRGIVQTDADDPVVRRVRDTPLAHRLEWFFKAPVWQTVHSEEQNRTFPKSGSIASVYDLRFRSEVIHRENPFEYLFQVLGDGHVALLK